MRLRANDHLEVDDPPLGIAIVGEVNNFALACYALAALVEPECSSFQGNCFIVDAAVVQRANDLGAKGFGCH